MGFIFLFLFSVNPHTNFAKILESVKQTSVDCNLLDPDLLTILNSLRPKDDYINVIVNCFPLETIRIINLVRKMDYFLIV